MECWYCEAKFQDICECSARMCFNHKRTHYKHCLLFGGTKLADENDKKRILSMKILKRIHRINAVCCGVMKKTQELIKDVKKMCDDKIKELRKIAEKYKKVLEKGEIHEIASVLRVGVVEDEILSPDTKAVVDYYSRNFYCEKEEFENIENAKRHLEDKYGLIIEGHTSYVMSVVVTRDSKYAVSGGDKTVRVWNIENKNQETILRGHTD